MSLLDGKYEILGEQSVGDGVAVLQATTPGGEAVRIEWFEPIAGDDAAFERYRRLLKRLQRDGRAHVLDVVERPGARYVAWRLAAPGRAIDDPALHEEIRAAGFDPTQADVRRVAGAPRLVALPFRGQAHETAAAPGPIRRRLRWPSTFVGTWIASGVLMAAALALATAAFERAANDRAVAIPDVLGRTYADAAAALAALGLAVVPTAVVDDSAPPLTVVAAEPTPGQMLRPGREVRLSVAHRAGQIDPASVPRVIGSTATAAEALLDGAGLRLGARIAVHLDAPAGIVLAQAPAPGAATGRGGLVDLVVSLGPRPVTTFVPDLTGRRLADALTLTNLAGLAPEQVIVERVNAEGRTEDTVIGQSLRAYRDVPVAGTVLRLLVADAPPIPDPDALPLLGGMSEAEARRMAASFDIEVEIVSDRVLPNGVIGQSLPPGARPSDGPLRLLVNVRPVPVPIPDVRVQVRGPEERTYGYRWLVEPGIRDVIAEVHATLGEGSEERILVARSLTRGGAEVSGAFATSYPGIVTFDLTLNGEPYAAPQRGRALDR